MKSNFFKTFAVFVVFICISLVFFFASKTGKESENSSLATRKISFFPKQFADREITENAKVADERFRNFALIDKKNLISSAINSWIKTDQTLTDGSMEKGTWLWTPTLQITPKYRDEIILGSKRNGVNVIYLSIDSYLDIFVMAEGEEKEKLKSDFKNVVRDFIKVANENGIKVDAEAGWQNWAKPEHIYKPAVILDFVINWNKENEEKFRGFQYDVESYLLPEYQLEKEEVLEEFLDLISQSVTKLSGTDLLFTVVVPEFYDGTYEDVPNFYYRWKRGSVIEHLLSILERRKGSQIIIMSYRNFSQGEDGSIDISRDEITFANRTNTKMIVAQETGDFPPEYITFYGKALNEYNSQLAQIRSAFAGDKSFNGVATHFVNSYLELR